MDYKKIIQSRKLRINIMRVLSFLPDKFVIKLQYLLKTGRKLNLKDPQRYSEKLQWYKLYYKDPLMGNCVDKYLVREYVKKQNLENILNTVYGVYDSYEDINFNTLPNQFVLKDTLGGGGTSVLIVKDKYTMNMSQLEKTLKSWTKRKYGKHPGREWVYDNKKSKIIIEKYIESNLEEGGLIDYKFFTFNGKVKYVYGMADRALGKGVGCGIFNEKFEQMPYYRADEKKLERYLKRPLNYEKMVQIAETLGKPFPHARIDLYNQNNKIIFGEITFFDGSGYMKFKPDEFDYIMGKEFDIPKKAGNK